MTELVKASAHHIPGIAAIVQAVWQREILTDVCRAQIGCNACALWVAEEGDDVVGFVSAFLTVGGDGQRRWEIDLLAVRPASQGNGIGRQLIEQATRIGEQKDVSLARAAVRVENTASQKAFTNAGFTSGRLTHDLLQWEPNPGGGIGIYGGDVVFIPVDTLTYRGVWLEGLTASRIDVQEQHSAVTMARSLVAWEGRKNVSTMLPISKIHQLDLALRETAKTHGQYYWFHKGNDSGQPLAR